MINIALDWKSVLEILILWYFIYIILILIKGTRTEQLLKGVIIIVIVFIITQQLNLTSINWVMTRLFPISVIALLIIFQPEMRRGLARLGEFGVRPEEVEVIEEIARASATLSKRKIGALIVIEREGGLKNYIESGVVIDSKVSQELITSIFMPQTILHDGAMIIRHDRIVAAGCLLPLTQETSGLSRQLGTRHRAAIGITEETDAVCVVVSEENSSISVAVGGKLTRDLNEESLVLVLKKLCYKSKMPDWHKKMLARLTPRVSRKGIDQ